MALRLSRCLVLFWLLPAALAVAADPPPVAPAPADSATVAPGICFGRVTDGRTGEPLASANVYVQGGQAGTISTLDGLFALRGAPAGPFTLVVTYLGYAPALTRVDASREGTLAIALEPTVYAGEEIVIDASRYGDDVHLSQTNLTREEIARGRSERDIPVLLEDLPGVYASSDAGNGVGYTYLNIRGFDQRRVGVMINGIPLNDPEDHQVYWVDMPDLAESLEDIQVQRGITNSMGGLTAIGGTVNLITEVLGPEPAGRATLRAGSYGTSQQSLAWQSGLRGGRFATALRISHLASDGYRQRAGSDQWAVFWSGQYVAPRPPGAGERLHRPRGVPPRVGRHRRRDPRARPHLESRNLPQRRGRLPAAALRTALAVERVGPGAAAQQPLRDPRRRILRELQGRTQRARLQPRRVPRPAVRRDGRPGAAQVGAQGPARLGAAGHGRAPRAAASWRGATGTPSTATTGAT